MSEPLLLWAVQTLSGLVIGVVCWLIKDIIKDHKDLLAAFNKFKEESAKGVVTWPDFQRYHDRLHELENIVYTIRAALDARGILKGKSK